MDGLLGQIDAERRGNAVDRGLLASVLQMLDALGLYTEAFEPPFLQQTDLFYAAEGLSGLTSMEVPEYLLHCEVCLPGASAACMQPQMQAYCQWHRDSYKTGGVQLPKPMQPVPLAEAATNAGLLRSSQCAGGCPGGP